MPVDQLISALKNFNGESDTKPNNRRFVVSDEENDEKKPRTFSQSRNQGRKATSVGVKRKLISSSQSRKYHLQTPNLALIDLIYHNQIRDTCKGM